MNKSNVGVLAKINSLLLQYAFSLGLFLNLERNSKKFY